MIVLGFTKRALLIALMLWAVGWPLQSSAQEICPPLDSKFGNRDYLNPSNQSSLRAVENAHFNEAVRQLRGGARPSGSLIGDLQYTLNWFPNHHAALDTLVRLALRERSPSPLGGIHIDCRFDWAQRVNPRDGTVHMLHAQYRQRLGESDRARELLERASALEPHNATLQYNVGLIYFRMNDLSPARQHARSAYRLGFPLPGLRRMLEGAGVSMAD